MSPRIDFYSIDTKQFFHSRTYWLLGEIDGDALSILICAPSRENPVDNAVNFHLPVPVVWSFMTETSCKPSTIWLFGDWPSAVRYGSGVQMCTAKEWTKEDAAGHHLLGFILLLVALTLGTSHFDRAGRKIAGLGWFQHHSASPNRNRVFLASSLKTWPNLSESNLQNRWIFLSFSMLNFVPFQQF